ncbi:hypothetical protein ABZ904_38350 [Streptomyces sp. NPDC046900]|uniref:hypothetical protein n=1 Tax=Streptomyces sp. NPDC046900 TaxID=3155473 RepID=UPI0033D4A732
MVGEFGLGGDVLGQLGVVEQAVGPEPEGFAGRFHDLLGAVFAPLSAAVADQQGRQSFGAQAAEGVGVGAGVLEHREGGFAVGTGAEGVAPAGAHQFQQGVEAVERCGAGILHEYRHPA